MQGDNRCHLLAVAIIMIVALAGCVGKEKSVLESELAIKKDIELGLITDTTIPLKLFIPVKNRSDRRITIQKVTKDCACMSVSIDKLVLAPGETATLRVVANLTGKTNPYISQIVVESDAAEKIDEIQIRGQITGQVRIRPAQGTVILGDSAAPGQFVIYCDNQNGEWKSDGWASDQPGVKISLNRRSETPTTSILDGKIEIEAPVWKNLPDYQLAHVTFKFINAKIDRHLEILYPIEIALRRSVEWDPPQVTFLSDGGLQSRSVLIQSVQALQLDAALCQASGVRTRLRRVNDTAWWVDLDYAPTLGQPLLPSESVVRVLADGKAVAAVPVNFVVTR